MIIRQAREDDVASMSRMLFALAEAGKRTRPSEPDFVRATYVANPERLSCTIAVDADGAVLGFQSLTLAVPGNPWGVEPGLGIIGTHVSPLAARRGIGRKLFEPTLEAARAADLRGIDAAIARDNTEGLHFYEAIGFRTYRETSERIGKLFAVSQR